MSDDVVRVGYTHWAQEYASRLGSMDEVDPADRQLVAGWAASLSGPLVDVGCGPGHWTDFLAGQGAVVEGIDLTPAFVELARARFPSRSFRTASLDDLGLPDGATAGILAWYSLIHLEPERMPVALAALARCLRPGGGLVVGFLPGEDLKQFAHTVAPAYFWSPDALVEHLEGAGFAATEVHTRENPDRPDRPHGAIVARRLQQG